MVKSRTQGIPCFRQTLKSKTRVSHKNMSRETTFHILGIAAIHFRLLKTIRHMLNIHCRSYRTFRDHKQQHHLCCTTGCERAPGLRPS